MADKDSRCAEYSIAELMDVVLDDKTTREMSLGRRATMVWFAANGDLERKHTTGVYLRESRARGAAPVLGVYLDSRMRVVDFSANKDLYIARVINQSFEISDIEFKLDRGRGKKVEDSSVPTVEDCPSLWPELSPEELAYVCDLTQRLPESLRELAQKAMISSIRHEKHLESQK